MVVRSLAFLGWAGAVALACASPLAGLDACDHPAGPSVSGDTPPSASVLSLGVTLGTCPDLGVCERECDAGSADRCRRLAATYALGDGVTRDEPRGTALYERACMMGDPSACVFAGQMHEYAHGVPGDDATAARFYARACDAAWSPGCYNLGILYETGHGVVRDRERAAKLFEVACTAGSQTACGRARDARRPTFLDPAPPDAGP